MNTKTNIDVKALSDEEKRRYYMEWKRSGLKALEFCREQGLSFMNFRYWCKRFKTQEIISSQNFCPVSVIPQEEVRLSEPRTREVTMTLAHGFQLQFTLPVSELLSLIRGLC